MRADQLSPKPDQRTCFAWSHHITVPDEPGCYALITFSGDLLYVGLATVSVRSRMGDHLDTEAKRAGTSLGVPFWFEYLIAGPAKVAAIERGWINQAILADGKMPALNKVHSPL